VNTGVRLIEQVRSALDRGLYPLFVAEGESKAKLARIRHSEYLARGLRSLKEVPGTLVVYGHSLAENDEHVFGRVAKGKIKQLFIGLYGNPESRENRILSKRAHDLTALRGDRLPLAVEFFDATSAHVWG
jgi:hypothetical protein